MKPEQASSGLGNITLEQQSNTKPADILML